MYIVVNVDSASADSIEPLGTKRKFWFRDNRGRRMLFKAEERGTGEDWAEKVACELCTLMGIPHVRYNLARESEGNRPGVVCESCAPPESTLCLGNQLLLDIDPAYPSAGRRKYKVREHTIEAVADVVRSLEPPSPEWTADLPVGIQTPLDVFAGYLMLDAWIANQDRHHENWGALSSEGALRLAPTFDHGASLARNLSDEEKLKRLTTKDANYNISSFVRRARSAFYLDAESEKPLTTIQAWLAISDLANRASEIWMEELRRIDDTMVEKVLDEVPPSRLSKLGKRFTSELLRENRERILNGDE